MFTKFTKKRSLDNLCNFILLFPEYKKILDDHNINIYGGLCHGLTCMWAEAILCKDEESFANRLNWLSDNNYRNFYNNIFRKYQYFNARGTSYSFLSKQPKCLPENALEIPAFIENILLHQCPRIFPFVKCTTQNIEKISKFTIPKKLEPKKDLTNPDTHDLVGLRIGYKEVIIGDIASVLSALKYIFNSLQSIADPYVIVLGSHKHIIGLAKEPGILKFKLFDQNLLSKLKFPKVSKVINGLDELTRAIFYVFFTPYKKRCVFSFTVYLSPGTNSSKMKEVFHKTNNPFGTMYKNPQWVGKDNVSLLYIACKKGHTDVVKEMLKHPKIDPNKATSDDGATPLFIACQNGHTDAVKEMLKHLKIDPNKVKTNGDTPLHMACQGGHTDAVKEMLKHPKTDPNEVRITDGATPLYMACQNGYTNVVKEMLKHSKIEPNKATTDDGITPLYIACQKGHTDLVKEMLKHPKIDPNKARINYGTTPLHMACYHGHTDAVKEMLKHPKTDPNKARTNGETALSIARKRGHSDIVKILQNRAKSNQCRLNSFERKSFAYEIHLKYGIKTEGY